jgi:hypothetical protein
VDAVKLGDLIVMGGTHLGRVIDPDARRNRARGVQVVDGGAYSRFVQDWCVHKAEIGKTVCEHPVGTHFCGLFHATPDDIETIRGQA